MKKWSTAMKNLNLDWHDGEFDTARGRPEWKKLVKRKDLLRSYRDELS